MAEEPLEPVGPPPEESQNRVFVLVALGLGGLFIIGLILIALFAFVVGPSQRRARSAAATGTAAGNQVLADALTATAVAGVGQGELATEVIVASPTSLSAGATNTPLIAPSATNTLPPTITNTAGPSPTTVIAGGGAALTSSPQPLRTRTPTPSLVGGVRSATPTQIGGVRSPTPTVVGGARTVTPTRRATSTALPTTGFADDVGAPGLLILGVGLIAVLFIARRLRLGRV